MPPTAPDPPPSPPTRATRRSLLQGLKEPGNQQCWEEFFDTYGRLIMDAAQRAGLSRAEAEEVLQETAVSVVKHIGEFKIDPDRGSFKNWLMRATRWRIVDQLRKRIPRGPNPPLARLMTPAGPALWERVPDPSAEEQAAWDSEWDKNRLANALARVKRKVKPKHYQIFYLYVLKELPLKEVSRRLKAVPSLIYVTKYRIQRMLEKELKMLDTGN